MFNKKLFNSSSGKRIVRDIVVGRDLNFSEKKNYSDPTKNPAEQKQKNNLKEEEKIQKNKSFTFFKDLMPRGKTDDKISAQKKKKSKISFKKILFFLILASGIILFADSSFGVLIKITPEQKTMPIDTTFIASQENGDLGLEIIKLKEEETGEIPASDFKVEEKKASGQIMVYNAFSPSPQIFVEKTRFENPDGKIYRIAKSITVPGVTKENGKSIPGSVETTVYADQPGEKYNIDFSDFTVPGFKNSPRYEKFFARSKTPMTGGGAVKIPVVNEKDREELNLSLENSLKERLLKKAYAQKPEEWILYDGAFEISFASEEISSQNNESRDESNSGKLSIKKTAEFYGALLNKDDLTKAINNKYLEPLQKENAEILNINELSFQLIRFDQKKNQMVFRTGGKANFIFLFDKEKLKQNLINAASDRNNVFKTYPEIKRAEIAYKPWWWRFFPKSSSKIEIEIVK